MEKQALSAALAAAPQEKRAAVFLEVLDDLIETVGEEAVVLALTEVFDRVLVPLDVPYTPEWIEKRVEAIVRANIPALVKAVHDAVHTP